MNDMDNRLRQCVTHVYHICGQNTCLTTRVVDRYHDLHSKLQQALQISQPDPNFHDTMEQKKGALATPPI